MARTKKTTPETAPLRQTTEANTQEMLTLRGRLVANPMLRTSPNGTPVANFRIAVNHPGGAVTFHNIVAWKRTAVAIATYLRKGRLVEVRGRQHRRTWTDEYGIDHWCSAEIRAITVQFLGRSQTSHTEAGA